MDSLRNIVQIYAGENMSFAVDKFGETFAWGENKHNALLVNEDDKQVSNVIIPAKVKYPGYFIQNEGDKVGQKYVNIVVNN